MAETQKSVEGTDEKQSASSTKSATPTVDQSTPTNTKQFSEEMQFTDTMTGTVVTAYSFEEAAEKINAETQKKENK